LHGSAIVPRGQSRYDAFAYRALAEFRERYNQRWIVQRLGYLTPAQARQQLLALGAAA